MVKIARAKATKEHAASLANPTLNPKAAVTLNATDPENTSITPRIKPEPSEDGVTSLPSLSSNPQVPATAKSDHAGLTSESNDMAKRDTTQMVKAEAEADEEPTYEELLEQERALERAIARKKQRRAQLLSPPHPAEAAANTKPEPTDSTPSPTRIKTESSLAYATPAPSSPNISFGAYLARYMKQHPTEPLPSHDTYDDHLQAVEAVQQRQRLEQAPAAAPSPAQQSQASYQVPAAGPQPAHQKQASYQAAAAALSPATMSGEAEPPLCAEQQELVNLILSGRNVFYTGSAGCGKSTVLKAFTSRIRAMGKQVDVVAPTGKAALAVHGSTTWTYAGMRPDNMKLPLQELQKLARKDLTWKRLNKTDVLVIDEVSMVENHHLERINEIMKSARGNPHKKDLPFGGVQMIVTGDFCQLPPVRPFQYCIQCGRTLIEGKGPQGKFYRCVQHGLYLDEDKWAFRSRAWQECDFAHFELKTVHRQSDALFVNMLQKCRLGVQLSEEDIDVLMNHEVNGVKKATQLHAVRASVEKVNRERFEALKCVPHTFYSLDRFQWRQSIHPGLGRNAELKRKDRDPRRPESMPVLEALKDHRFEERVELKTGMLVVLLTNLDLGAGLYNGSQGTICGWETFDPKLLPKAASRFGKKEEPEPGKRISGDRAEMKEAHLQQFMDSQFPYRVVNGEQIPQRRSWPKVVFNNGQRRTIYPECSVSELGDEQPYSLLSRTQVPLAPAWAMTIHKAQGMSMDQVVVNLSRAFEEGQVYVALSRARTLEGLKIEGTSDALRSGIGSNREVQQFLRDNFGGPGGCGEIIKGEVDEESLGIACPGAGCAGCEECCG